MVDENFMSEKISLFEKCEVLNDILSFLSANDILIVEKLSKYLYNHISRSIIWPNLYFTTIPPIIQMLTGGLTYMPEREREMGISNMFLKPKKHYENAYKLRNKIGSSLSANHRYIYLHFSFSSHLLTLFIYH